MMYTLERPSARVIGRDDDDDTIELELNESAIRLLNEAAALAQAASEERLDPGSTSEVKGFRTWGLERETPAASHAGEALEQKIRVGSQGSVPVARSPRMRRGFVLGLGMAAVVGGLLGGLAYLATARARHPVPVPVVADSGSHPTAAPEAPMPTSVSAAAPSEASDTPVRFKNPFDATEVFEFPAGTSQSEVRAAVAELLSQRARERQSLLEARPRRNTKTADRNMSITAGRVTPRS
jgi:hypothetical protein